MKKSHILLLVLLAILLMSSFLLVGDLSSYASIEEAKSHPKNTYSIVGKIDTSFPVFYNPIKNPNYFSFTLVDSAQHTIHVIYKNAKPTDIEKAARLVLKGSVIDGDFQCKEILMKCPSKYEDGNFETVTFSTERE